MALKARYTLFAEGSHGHLGQQLIHLFNLDQDRDPQHYGLGFKELWDLPPEAEHYHEGKVIPLPVCRCRKAAAQVAVIYITIAIVRSR